MPLPSGDTSGGDADVKCGSASDEVLPIAAWVAQRWRELQSMTVAILKSIVKAYGVVSSGLKADLVTRILEFEKNDPLLSERAQALNTMR